MRTAEEYHCDRCGIKMSFPEFMLKIRSKSSGHFSYMGDGFDVVGQYCKMCGYLIYEAANISRMDKAEEC